jgi:hypothetical protein
MMDALYHRHLRHRASVLLVGLCFCRCVALGNIRAFKSEGATHQDPALGVEVDDEGCPGSVRDPAAPVLFFSDLTSAPRLGGEAGQGAFVTLYGLRLGDTQGDSRVFFAGEELRSVLSWGVRGARGLESIVVQLPADAPVGVSRFSVRVGERPSNGLSFTVRDNGRYWVVDKNASTGGDGSFVAPFASLFSARLPAVSAGDVIYIKAGAYEEKDDACARDCHWALSKDNAAVASPDLPIAYVSYPGAHVALGVQSAAAFADVLVMADAIGAYHFSGLNFYNGTTRIKGKGVRLIGNGFFTTLSSYFERSIAGSSLERTQVFGNTMRSQGNGLSADAASDVEIAWNELAPSYISLFLGGLSGQISRVRIHGNLLRGPILVGVENAPVEDLAIDNNVNLYQLLHDGFTSLVTKQLSSTPTLVRHNLFLQTGPMRLPTVVAEPGTLRLENNVVFLADGQSEYFQNLAMAQNSVSGGVNQYYGNDASSAEFLQQEARRIVSRPLLMGVTQGDYRPALASAGVGQAPWVGVCEDYYGVRRQKDGLSDLGPAEHTR